jgi:hypothetical protein
MEIKEKNYLNQLKKIKYIVLNIYCFVLGGLIFAVPIGLFTSVDGVYAYFEANGVIVFY